MEPRRCGCYGRAVSAERAPLLIRQLRGVRWWLGPTTDREQATPLLAAAIDAIESGATNLKSGRRKELYRLTLLGDGPDDPGPDHLLKVTRYHNGSPWTRRIRKSKARRELEIAVRLRAREINTPLPVAAGESRRGGLLTACYLLVPFERDALDLAAFANSPASAWMRRAITTEFGALARRLHGIGFRQADFAPNNFLLRLAARPEIVPIDFERATLSNDSAGLDRHERVQSLAKLERHCRGATAADRLRFLVAYAGGRVAARRDWRETERAIASLYARDLKRLRTTRGAGGRRHERFRAGDWHGWAMRQRSGLGPIKEWLARDTSAARVYAQPAWWVCSYLAGSDPSAADLWATSQALWVRGLSPEPICVVQRGREIRLFLGRDIPVPSTMRSDQPEIGAERDFAPAQRLVVALIDRLLGLGDLSPEIAPESVGVAPRADGSNAAVLIDVSLLRVGIPVLSQRRDRAREIADRLSAGGLVPKGREAP